LYLAEFEGRCIGAVIVFRFRGKTYLKYEVVDDDYRDQRPVYAMLWRSIEESAQDGDHTYDFGRTEKDNTGLADFKSRWGTTRVELPYHFNPPGDAPSVVDSSSLKYRVFTGVFRLMPTALSKRIGEKIFRHFG
jgi:lipid II:glycine glycyltransferase (peptidoglycan interpeptide bridge formation enzyme)